MRFIRIAGLCLVALAAMAMATAATASAQPVWEVNGTPVAGTEKVMGSGTLRLADTNTLLGESAVECSGTSTGTIGPGKIDRVETITVASCKKILVCENVETVKPLHLPWQTELYETESKVLNKISEIPSNGEPGWAVTCKTIGGRKTDECVTEAGKEGNEVQTNVTPNELGTFNPTSKADCTEGGKAAGKVEGIITTLSEPIGKVISVS
jgi:hypothetical protein